MTLVRDGPHTTSLVIAQGAEKDHASAIKLIPTCKAHQGEFGGLGWGIRPFDKPGGRQTREGSLLNTDPATQELSN